jgi:AbrB family looped-hinge helix DNA binding protein
MPVVTKVSELGKMNIPAQIRRQTGLERGGPVVMTVVAGEIRLRPVRSVLSSLQTDADAVFAGSGETVERFLAERRAEAAREDGGAPETDLS